MVPTIRSFHPVGRVCPLLGCMYQAKRPALRLPAPSGDLPGAAGPSWRFRRCAPGNAGTALYATTGGAAWGGAGECCGGRTGRYRRTKRAGQDRVLYSGWRHRSAGARRRSWRSQIRIRARRDRHGSVQERRQPRGTPRTPWWTAPVHHTSCRPGQRDGAQISATKNPAEAGFFVSLTRLGNRLARLPRCRARWPTGCPRGRRIRGRGSRPGAGRRSGPAVLR